MKKVMFLDDDKLMHLTLDMARKGCEDISFVKFLNPLDAINYLKSNTVDLIITDYEMPQMTGVEFLNKLNGKYPAVAYSGYSDAKEMFSNCKNVLDVFEKWEIDECLKFVQKYLLISKQITGQVIHA